MLKHLSNLYFGQKHISNKTINWFSRLFKNECPLSTLQRKWFFFLWGGCSGSDRWPFIAETDNHCCWEFGRLFFARKVSWKMFFWGQCTFHNNAENTIDILTTSLECVTHCNFCQFFRFCLQQKVRFDRSGDFLDGWVSHLLCLKWLPCV